VTDTGFEAVRTAAVEGTRLAYREEGAGEAVVFVHGGLSDLRTWQPQLAAVGRSHRAISYSRRYARPNPDIDPTADDPWARHAEDLVALLHALDAAPAHLVGNSQGAFICLLAAAGHPTAVRSLVLEEPPVLRLLASAPPRPGELLRLFATRPRAALAILDFGARTIGPVVKAFRRGEDEQAMRTFVRGVLGPAAAARLPKARVQQMRDNLSTLRASLLGSGIPPIDAAALRGIRAPALLLTGEHSPYLLRYLSGHLAGLLPDSESAEIPDASHAMHEENPTAVNAAILGFLARRGGSPATGPSTPFRERG
jgi:pimeloyl-ACP methyl ester carboxylesterase